MRQLGREGGMAELNPVQWDEAKRLFMAAAELRPEDLSDYLQRECPDHLSGGARILNPRDPIAVLNKHADFSPRAENE